MAAIPGLVKESIVDTEIDKKTIKVVEVVNDDSKQVSIRNQETDTTSKAIPLEEISQKTVELGATNVEITRDIGNGIDTVSKEIAVKKEMPKTDVISSKTVESSRPLPQESSFVHTKDEIFIDSPKILIPSKRAPVMDASPLPKKVDNKEDKTAVVDKHKILDDVKRQNAIKKINEIDLAEIKRKQTLFGTNKQTNITPPLREDKSKVPTTDTVKTANEAQKLEKEIINVIKKKLIKTVNELEILQSELYILSEVNGDSKVLKECQKELDQVKSILCKIDKLKEQYDFLKDNYDFEYLLEIDDNNLVDKIIELKDKFGNNELKAVSEDYKLLDVYKYLYLKIDDLQEKTAKYEEHKEEEVAKLKERDINFEELKRNVYNVKSTNDNYDYFVKQQSELLHEIDENISKISSYEQVNYRLKGFGALFRNSFKYFGLLMVNPLKGVIPSIATETLITGNLIKNLYRNLEWEERRQTIYEAMDYSSMINNAINDLESTNRIVDTTLDDIIHLKIKYNEQFKRYQGDFLEYRDIMHKISDMENKILGNKIKIEIMRQRALEQQRINDKKMALVKKLNNQENHN